MQRRLAAILAADVAGYSRLMGSDEIGTLRSLKAHRRELVDAAIAEHHGRIAPAAYASQGLQTIKSETSFRSRSPILASKP